jgi:hypothetical protein
MVPPKETFCQVGWASSKKLGGPGGSKFLSDRSRAVLTINYN